MRISLIMVLLVLAGWLAGTGCQNNNQPQPVARYTCPMPQDSVFSDKPGKCPKCGMELIPISENHSAEPEAPATTKLGYTCPMHPQVHQDEPGRCPICGMDLEKEKPEGEGRSVSLNTLLKPVNQQVVANVPMVHLMDRTEDIDMETYGFVAYDTRKAGAIAANVSGRIEKLYVSYRYQQVSRGQKIMEIYSPELLTAQENLLFVAKNDPDNKLLIRAARQKLLLMGMSEHQLEAVISSGKPSYRVTLYSGYSGHIHESENESASAMPNLETAALNVKEGMYVQKGQSVFSVYDPARAWVLLNIFAGEASMIKTGNKVLITPETDPEKTFRASVSYIEPFYRENSKTLTARVYFNNSQLQIPIGSQVKANVYAGQRKASWLPEEAVLSLGLDKVVFVRSGEAFLARKIETGIIHKHLIQVRSGLQPNEAVAANAQYLVDSESFIKTH